MSSSWIFPVSNSYQNRGITANEIDSKDTPTQTFAREILQNSNDARNPDTPELPVTVEFKIFKISTDEFPDIDGLRNTVDLCITEAHNMGGKRDFDFFMERHRVLKEEKLTVMRISDYNTTGLIGSSENDDVTTPWNSATMGNGVTSKSGNTGGSKGRGKDSFFRMSNIGCVFFSTHAVDGNDASVGCSRQITYHDENGEKHEDFGCYLNDSGKHSTSQLSLEPGYERTGYGTDIYIPGYREEDDTQFQIMLAAVSDFFVSILDGKLIVKVNGIAIDKDHIEAIVSLLANKNIDSAPAAKLNRILENIECYKGGPTVKNNDYEIYIRNSERAEGVTSIRAGMTISDRFMRMLYGATALAVIRGPEASQLLASTEDISHTKWRPENIYGEKRERAKRLISQIKNDIRAEYTKLKKFDEKPYLEATGLSDVLSIVPQDESSEVKVTKYPIEKISRVRVSKKIKKKTKNAGGDSDREEIMPSRSDEEGEQTIPWKPTDRNSQDAPARTVPDPDSDFKRAVKAARIGNVRYLCINQDTREYVATFSSQEEGNIFLRVLLKQPENKPEVPIDSKSAFGSEGDPLPISEGRIGPISVKKGEEVSIRLTLDYPIPSRIDIRGEKVAE